MALRVRVQPRASREEVAGARAGALVVRLTAPPLEGEANRSLLRFLARALDVPPSTIRVVRGGSSRDKLLHVSGLSLPAARERLAAALARKARG